jgi:molybdate transport system permease protein
LSESGHSWLRRISIGAGIILTAFILIVLLLIVTYSSPEQFISSLFSDEIQFAIYLSLATSLTSTFFCILFGVPAAYALARYNFRGKAFLNTILNLPLALPPLIAGVGLLLLFAQTPIGHALAEIGIEFIFTPLGIIVAQFFVNLPFMLRIMKSTFESIDPRYEHVARTLGCSEFEAFRRVTLPMAKNGFMAATVITWSRGIGEFGAALMVAGATRMQTESLPVAVFLNMSTGNLALATSAATILIIIAIVSLYLFERVGGKSGSGMF